MNTPFDRPGRQTMPPRRPDGRRPIIVMAVVAFIALFVLPWLASFATEWLWFRQVGFSTVFLTSLVWRVALFVLGGLLAYAVLGGNIRIATAHGASCRRCSFIG